jgi:ABC-2 type transport system ATP-binding protein
LLEALLLVSSVHLDKLSKFYGNTVGIVEVSFDVYPGEVFGILGPNGAGKTTAIRTLLGLIKATSGKATILGRDALVPNVELREQIGYLPGIAATYDRYTARGYLRFIASMRKMNLDDEIENLSTRLDLDLDSHIHDLSKGNRQKVSVIQAFMHKPQVLFLDEPTSGLDPIVQREFEKLLHESKRRGAAILLSSHVLSEVEHLADRIAIFFKGKILVVDEISKLKEKARHRIEFTFSRQIAGEDFGQNTNISEIEVEENRLSCVVRGSQRELLTRAVELGAFEVRTQESSLEEIFLDLIGAK